MSIEVIKVWKNLLLTLILFRSLIKNIKNKVESVLREKK